MAKKTNEKLTERQKKFCREYVLTLNATKAAESAGYSKKTAYAIGCENLKKLEVQNYIKELRKEEEENFYYSRTMSFKKLEEAQKMALDNVFVKVTKDGETIKIPKPDLAVFLKAEELKGKLNGLYEPEIKQDITINTMGSVKVGGKTLTLKIGDTAGDE